MKKRKLLTLAAAIAVSSSALASPAGNYDTNSWMGDVFEGREHTQLRDIVIPGTHDSGTYNITSSSTLDPKKDWFYELAKGVVADWSVTNNYNIYDQLQHGIRYFDLRIQKIDGEFVMVHALVGMKLSDMLIQVRNFADQHPKEVILLEFANTPDASDIPDMMKMVKYYIGDRMPSNNTTKLSDLTLAELWADDSLDGKNNNVLAAVNDSTAKSLGMFSSASSDGISGGFANTTSSGPLLSHNTNLVTNWNAGSKASLLYTAYTYTPQTDDIVDDIFNNSSSETLEAWSDRFLRPVLGDLVTKLADQGLRSNIIATDFHEYTAVVGVAIQQNTIAPQNEPTTSLVMRKTNSIDQIWNDAGTGADSGSSIWRARTEGGYYPLGDMAVSSHQFPGTRTAYLIKGDQPGVSKPLGYNWVWNDRSSGGNQDISLWKPIAPAGYVCLGDVITNNHGMAPSTDLIRCVHESFTLSAPSIGSSWNDSGSGADYNVSFWQGYASDASALNTRSLRSARSHSNPDRSSFRLINANKASLVADRSHILNSMTTGETYSMNIHTKHYFHCGLEWTGDLGDSHIQAQFDCDNGPDKMLFTATSNPSTASGVTSLNGYLHTKGGKCGMEWDGGLSDGERNAKFDCANGGDELTISSLPGLGVDDVKLSTIGCGLQFSGGGNATTSTRNAKWDCSPAYDSMTLVSTTKESVSAQGNWTNSAGRSESSTGNPSYILKVKKGNNITIDLTSSVDTYLYVREINTNWHTDNDDGGDGHNSRVRFNTYSGSGYDYYRITAATYSSGKSGAFTINASQGESLTIED
jgi:hypothetical protein